MALSASKPSTGGRAGAASIRAGKADPAALAPAAPAERKPGRMPWVLLALVFVPAMAGYAFWFRSLESLRFAHPLALATIPLAVALVLWAGVKRGEGRRPVLVFSRAGELGRGSRGLIARLADLPVVLR